MPRPSTRRLVLAPLLVAAFVSTACEQAYFYTQEVLGHPKRQILVERVEGAREAQKLAKNQFESALEAFQAATDIETTGELKDTYLELKAEFESARTEAEAVHEDIDKVQSVAEALFDEWEAELDDYEDRDLRLASEIKLRDTQKRYAQLMQVMLRAEDRMDPVLEAFEDRVLFLKHNLNARAVAGLDEMTEALRDDIAELVEDMTASIEEADRFIEAMETREPVDAPD